MPPVGSRIGVYEVTGRLGAGGMGEVFRARDTRLHRDVALKVLLPAVADDPERLARFGREAQVLASLDHPNIARVYGFEDADGTRALVMELVEGPTLADRLEAGALPLEEALPIARQIAEALEAAHEHAIIHRDLKPSNIKIRDDGTVKVLDFGLAKAVEPAGASATPHVAESPTITSPAMTRAGVILGTAAYMSPEQAKGRPVDKRSDVWAFGCVLYEMLAGVRPFDGEDMTDVLGAVVRLDPDWTRLPASTPPSLRALVSGCLVKDRRQRVSDLAAARFVLDQLTASGPSTSVSPAIERPSARRVAPLVAASVLGGAVLATGLGAVMPRFGVGGGPVTVADAPVMRFSIVIPQGLSGNTPPPALSPDGRYVAFRGGDNRLWLRAIDALTAQPIPGAEGGTQPFWSPDGRNLGFFAGRKLKRISVAGGPALALADVGLNPTGGSWSDAGTIVFAPDALALPLHQVPAAGGAAVPVTALDPGAHSGGHLWPHFLPDGRRFLFTAFTRDLKPVLLVGSLDTTASTPLTVSSDSSAIYAEPGVLLFARGNTLLRQAFDPEHLTVTGEATPIADDLAVGSGQSALVSASRTGALVYTTAAPAERRQLVWVDRQGAITPLALAPAAYGSPSLSPDGRQLALSVTDASGTHIWVHDLARGTFAKRTFEGTNEFPIWTPDGRGLVFSTAVLRGPLMNVPADGSGRPETLTGTDQGLESRIATSWSADGTQLVFQREQDLFVRSADGTLQPLLATPALEREGRIAPGGRWLAYSSNDTGRREVWVQSFPPGGGRWQISTSGGAQPMWAANGRELFFKSGDRMMVVPVDNGPRFSAATPRQLFELPQPERIAGDPARYAVTPDAQRFLVLTTVAGESSQRTMTVVLNWPAAVGTSARATP